jgi:hypothetical protein
MKSTFNDGESKSEDPLTVVRILKAIEQAAGSVIGIKMPWGILGDEIGHEAVVTLRRRYTRQEVLHALKS